MIENTSHRDPELHLLGMMGEGGTSKYITDMEAQGQRALVASQDLPTNCGGDVAYLALGFTFGEPHKHDPLFRPATLPVGWKREGSDHAMWSYIVDELGRRRVGIFYKAAFYDRRADMRLETVYGYVSSIVWDSSAPLILDDTWATREAVAEALADCRRGNQETVDLYSGRTTEYARERLAEVAEQNRRIDALLAEVTP